MKKRAAPDPFPPLSSWLAAEMSVDEWRAARLYAGKPATYWTPERERAVDEWADSKGLR